MNVAFNRMAALESYLLATVSPTTIFLAAAPTVAELRERLGEITDGMAAVQNRADAESRPLTQDEDQAIENLFAEFESLTAEIDRRERIESARAHAAAPQGRRTEPAAPGGDPAPQNAGTQPRRRVPATPRDPASAENHGFRHMGEFAMAVRRAAPRAGGEVDPRLIANAPTEYGREGSGEDGGFAVPPEFRREIMRKVLGEESLISRTDKLTSSSNSVTVPMDETTPWQATGGIQAYWENEGSQLTQSKPQLDNVTLRLNKLTALVPVTEELLEDGPALAGYISSKAPEKMDFKLTDAIINGTGAGQPLGILKAPSLVTVDKESGQAADTIVFQNIVNMWSRLYSKCRLNAVWLINSDIEPQLMSMQFPGTGTAVPAYLPPGGLADAPYGRLLNRPVLPMEAVPGLGDAGDIILVDLSKYLTVTKGGGIRTDVSMHLFFDYDITAYRFIMRVAGQPWWKAAIAKKNGGNTLSYAVTLAERA